MATAEQSSKSALALRWRETFAALRHYNYRLWFIGQVVSLVGTWMQSTAQGYLIYQITGSPAYLGLVGFVGGAPSLIFTLFGGVIADRLPRRKMLVITQTSMMILAFILAALTFMGLVLPWHIIVLAFLLGVANAFDAPARTSFILELVSREDMTNAIALNSTMFNIGTVVGPAIAGLTYAAFGPAWCFTINGISFIAVIVALLLMRIKLEPQAPRQTRALAELGEGIRYVLANRLILSLIISVGIVSVFGIGMMNLLPAWAKDVLNGDVTTNGWLVSARGFGSLVSALMLAYWGTRKARGKLWTIGAFVMPVMLVVFALTRWLPLSLIFLVAIGWSFMMVTNNSHAIVQSLVPDELRGRVMGVYTLVFFGSMPIGALLAGELAQRIGETVTVILSGLVMMVLAIVAWKRLPDIRTQE
ncbi:MAG TPA: MFS transporter [Anaerolineales bacterium]|nr:MFS transporter [Anaerolineales bacterium]